MRNTDLPPLTGLGSGVANPGLGTYQSLDQPNNFGKGLILTIDITAIAGGATLTVTILGKDNVSGKYRSILATTALAAVATTTLEVYPGLTAAANSIASDLLPCEWAIKAVVAVANNITYTIGVDIIG